MHIVLSGACPLVKVRLSGQQLTLGFVQNYTAAHNHDRNSDSHSIHFSGHCPEPNQLQWISLCVGAGKDQPVLNSLELRCCQTRVELESCELASEFCLNISGDDNTLQVWHLSGMRLSLEAGGHHNSVSFAEPEAPLQEARLRLTGCYNQIKDLWLLGCSFSSISVANCSVVIAALEPDTQERCFEFNRDQNSRILVQLPNEGDTRQVHSEHELWSFDSSLLSIITHPKAKPLTRPTAVAVESESTLPEQRFICGICRTAAPDHLLQPCGHLFFCEECFARCPEVGLRCPVCRSEIQAVQRIFPIVGC